MARSRKPDLFIPSSEEQAEAARAIDECDLVFLIGPAGTGKSHIAASKAAEWLRKNKYARIVLARPAIGGGEKLGYLPGTREEKIEAYLRPVLRILGEIEDCDDEVKARVQRDNVIEFATFEHMRGETYANCFVIVDEAQNATREQTKMYLTRLGRGSKMVVTGDVEQCDLPRGISGLEDVVERVEGIDGIAVCRLTAEVSNNRHPLVTKILASYR